MRLALQLSTYQSTKFLPSLLDSLVAQTNRDWVCYVRDDGSPEHDLEETKKIIDQYSSRCAIRFSAGENIGFAGSHQKMYAEHDEDLILVVNHDVILDPSYIEILRAYFESHDDVAAASGAILRWKWNVSGAIEYTRVVDSLGLARTPWHKVYDIGSGVMLESVTHRVDRVFGVSGCLPMYRRQALGDTMFDPSYLMYKEDVDVAYRLQKEGWRAACVPFALAYHFRGFQASKFHIGVSVRFQELSYRNHWRNLFRHLSFHDWFHDGWAIVPFECVKAVFMAIFHPGILFRTVRYIFSHPGL